MMHVFPHFFAGWLIGFLCGLFLSVSSYCLNWLRHICNSVYIDIKNDGIDMVIYAFKEDKKVWIRTFPDKNMKEYLDSKGTTMESFIRVSKDVWPGWNGPADRSEETIQYLKDIAKNSCLKVYNEGRY